MYFKLNTWLRRVDMAYLIYTSHWYSIVLVCMNISLVRIQLVCLLYTEIRLRICIVRRASHLGKTDMRGSYVDWFVKIMQEDAKVERLWKIKVNSNRAINISRLNTVSNCRAKLKQEDILKDAFTSCDERGYLYHKSQKSTVCWDIKDGQCTLTNTAYSINITCVWFTPT